MSGSKRFAGRTAVITGASRGLGAGMAQHMHAQGVRLALCARSEPVLAGADGVFRESFDVRDAAAVEAFAAAAAHALGGAIDLWINNAGVLEPIGPLRDAHADDVSEHVEINLLGTIWGTRAYARHVRAHDGGGVLVNVSSGAGRKPYAGWGPYCAAKAGVDRLTECVALEEADAGLRAYALAPGVIDTDMQARIRASDEQRFPDIERFRRRKREGDFNSARWVAGRVLDLAFPDGKPESDVVVRLEDEPR